MLNDKEWLSKQVADKPLRHIADELNVPYSRVYAAVKKLGIVTPERRGYVYSEESRKAKSEAIKAVLAKKYPDGRNGELASNWKGGRHEQKSGYVMLYAPEHPRAAKLGRVFEHIIVAEKKIGRYLTKDEVVHHINGDKADNRPENLEVCLRSEHVHHHFTSGRGIQSLSKRIQYLEDKLREYGIKFD